MDFLSTNIAQDDGLAERKVQRLWRQAKEFRRWLPGRRGGGGLTGLDLRGAAFRVGDGNNGDEGEQAIEIT
jgi:hypothetical protein